MTCCKRHKKRFVQARSGIGHAPAGWDVGLRSSGNHNSQATNYTPHFPSKHIDGLLDVVAAGVHLFAAVPAEANNYAQAVHALYSQLANVAITFHHDLLAYTTITIMQRNTSTPLLQ